MTLFFDIHDEPHKEKDLPLNESIQNLLFPVVFLRPNLINDHTAWVGHIPFAFWLMKATQPTLFVELGTHAGNSYSAFLQAAVHENIQCRAFAVDTWLGDPHSGFYGNEIFYQLSKFNSHYESISTLLRMTFDEALERFSDESIDLLHIDGYHTYEAVKQDFLNWLPKMSKSGIILFHDINIRNSDFGVWRFWDEIKDQYPYFEFHHSSGLGILSVGEEMPELIQWLTSQSKEGRELIQLFFATLGERSLLLSKNYINNTKILKLQDKIAIQKNNLEQQSNYIVKLESSTSWNLTKPFRVAANYLRKIKNIMQPST